jgi:hypothetical protein
MRLDENILRIKEVMGLITEAEVNPQGVEINLGNLFKSGKYIITPEIGTKINSAINQIKAFITKNPGKPVVVTIESSESKVPNYDREKFPSTGNNEVDFTKEKKMVVGALSKIRANNLSTYLKPKLPKSAQIVINDKGAQGPTWDGVNADAEKYTQKQYVKLFAKLNTTQPTTSTPKTDPKFCTQEIESSGGKGNPSNGFISEVKTIELGEGENTFKFFIDSISVPDIMIVEYNGVTQTTGFVGSDTELYQTLLGTIIYNRYDNWGNPRPWWFKNLKLVGVQPYHADQVLKKYSGDWTPDDLSHIYPKAPKLSTTFFQTMTKNPDEYVGNFKVYKLGYDSIKTMAAGVDAWNGPSSITINKVAGVNTAKVTIIGLIGQTKWKLYVKCGNIAPMLTTAGGPGGDA